MEDSSDDDDDGNGLMDAWDGEDKQEAEQQQLQLLAATTLVGALVDACVRALMTLYITCVHSQ